ncbi:SERTA domain-containing protein 2b [Polypterus senegalus]
MLGKGAKRKFDENEEGLEGKAVLVGEGPSKVSYTLQRQTIFNISLMKLYNHRALTEPSLQRRVLINNMLRRIQEEFKQEGSLRPMFFTPSQQQDNSLDDGYREAQPAFSILSSIAQPLPQPSSLTSTTPLDSCLTPASLLEDDSSYCTSPVTQTVPEPQTMKPPLTLITQTAKDSFSSALDEIEELCPASTSPETAKAEMPDPRMQSSPLPSPTGDCKDSGKVCPQKFEGLVTQETKVAAITALDSRQTDSLSPSNLEMTASSGFLTDLALDDILFADIDTSMYDFDPYTSATGGASKIAPVTADDLLKTLSPYNNQPVPPNQPFKMDLTELDHIMEVLVGS